MKIFQSEASIFVLFQWFRACFSKINVGLFALYLSTMQNACLQNSFCFHFNMQKLVMNPYTVFSFGNLKFKIYLQQQEETAGNLNILVCLWNCGYSVGLNERVQITFSSTKKLKYPKALKFYFVTLLDHHCKPKNRRTSMQKKGLLQSVKKTILHFLPAFSSVKKYSHRMS